MRIFYVLVLGVMLSCSCSALKQEAANVANKSATKTVEKIIDEKVSGALETQLPKAINEGIGEKVMQYAPYGFSVLLAALLGKLGWDKRKQKGKL